MTQLAEIQGHIASMDTLLDIVGAMRSLAGMRMQEAHQALAGIRRYTDSIVSGIGTSFRLVDEMPPPPQRRGARALVLCMAEHGFVGGFNERLAEAASAIMAPDDRLFVLGTRGAAVLFEHHHKVDWVRPMASRFSGVRTAIDALTTAIYAAIADGSVDRVELLFTRFQQETPAAIERRLLLPFERPSVAEELRRSPPLHYLEPHELIERLIAEYVFALLTEAAVESIASENAARFAAMAAAHDNVAKKLGQLQQTANQARQEEITTELLDLITGTEAQA